GAVRMASPFLDLLFSRPPPPQNVGVRGSKVRAKTIAGLCCPESQLHTMTTSM
ncbi:unnamed protein product, partial [Tetraodon nigroviridis]